VLIPQASEAPARMAVASDEFHAVNLPLQRQAEHRRAKSHM
jgi:hypothetical protein